MASQHGIQLFGRPRGIHFFAKVLMALQKPSVTKIQVQDEQTRVE